MKILQDVIKIIINNCKMWWKYCKMWWIDTKTKALFSLTFHCKFCVIGRLSSFHQRLSQHKWQTERGTHHPSNTLVPYCPDVSYCNQTPQWHREALVRVPRDGYTRNSPRWQTRILYVHQLDLIARETHLFRMFLNFRSTTYA